MAAAATPTMDTGPQSDFSMYVRLQTELLIIERLSSERSKHCKLSVNGPGGITIVDSGSIGSAWYRWWTSESREKTVCEVNRVFTETHELLQLLVTNRMMVAYEDPKREYWVRDILALCDLAERAAQGLNALRETYKSHIPTVSQLTSAQERVARMVAPVRETVRNLERPPTPPPPTSAATTDASTPPAAFTLNAFARSYRADSTPPSRHPDAWSSHS